MFKRFRRSAQQIIIGENSSSDEEQTAVEVSTVLVRKRPANNKKYVQIFRNKTLNDSRISDSSSNEEQEQENKRCLLNASKYRDNDKPSNKFQPLCLVVGGKQKSPTSSPSSSCNMAKSYVGTPPTAWHSLRSTLTSLKRERSVFQTTILEHSFNDCSQSISLEANLNTSIHKQPLPLSVKRSAGKRLRYVKGGYLQEYNRLLQRQRMDRRSLQHNQRLGIGAGQRVQVLDLNESFGVQMARVQSLDGSFNVIVPPQLAERISVGSQLELHFDPQAETALQLSNKQLVYIQPNKLVLL